MAECTKLPMMVMDVHIACNLTCSYCVSGSSPQNDFGPMADPSRLQAIKRFFESHGPFNLLVTGGEPLITPDIFDFFTQMRQQGHQLSIQSNLKVGAKRLVETLRPSDIGWILSTFHSVELVRFPRYLDTVKMLKQNGYPVVVKLVLDPPMDDHFARLHDQLAENGIGVLLSPLMSFNAGRAFSREYLPNQWTQIAPRIHAHATWLYFSGGFESEGTRCRAGSEYFYAHTTASGSISGCAHNFPKSLGNIYSNELEILDTPVACGLKYCSCDFHYYTGVIDSADDQEHFYRLLAGENLQVDFEDFEDWLTAGGVLPVVHLRPTLEKAGVVELQSSRKKRG